MENIKLDKKNIGLRIRTARENMGWTRERLAEEVGLSVNSLANIELGHSGTQLENFVKLCTLLGLNADFVLFGEATDRPAIQRIVDLLTHQDAAHICVIEHSIQAMLEVMKS